MHIDATLTTKLPGITARAAELEALGYDAIWTGETSSDPFLVMLQAANATTGASIGISIAIAFGRSPLTVATSAYDLALYSQGRFILGLGSQVKAHIEKRFSMPWSHPAPRMREFVLALRAIWDCWENGTKLDFRGEFYTHTLMTPFFSPERHSFGRPPVMLAGVGSLMTEVAGEVGDGFFIHPFTTQEYVRSTTLPALERGRATAGKSGLEEFTIAGPLFITMGRNDEEIARAKAGTKNQIAFYASTPAYRGVLEAHGWGDLQTELNAMTKAGRWGEIGSVITDEILETFSPIGTPDAAARELVRRFHDVSTRFSFYVNYPCDPELVAEAHAAARDEIDSLTQQAS